MRSPALRRCLRPRGSGGDDLELEGRRDLRVQADCRLVGAERLDGLLDLDLALVERRATGSLDGGSDVAVADGAEEATGLAGLGRDLDRRGLELALDTLGGVEVLDLADRAALGQGVDLLLAALRPRGRETARP